VRRVGVRRGAGPTTPRRYLASRSCLGSPRRPCRRPPRDAWPHRTLLRHPGAAPVDGPTPTGDGTSSTRALPYPDATGAVPPVTPVPASTRRQRRCTWPLAPCSREALTTGRSGSAASAHEPTVRPSHAMRHGGSWIQPVALRHRPSRSLRVRPPAWRSWWLFSHSSTVSLIEVVWQCDQGIAWCGTSGRSGRGGQPAAWQIPPVSTRLARRSCGFRVRSVWLVSITRWPRLSTYRVRWLSHSHRRTARPAGADRTRPRRAVRRVGRAGCPG